MGTKPQPPASQSDMNEQRNVRNLKQKTHTSTTGEYVIPCDIGFLGGVVNHLFNPCNVQTLTFHENSDWFIGILTIYLS